MRKLAISAFLLFCSMTVVLGQDSSLAAPRGISYNIKKKISKSKDRLVIDFCLMNAIIKKDGGVTVPDNFKVSGFSRGINVYFMYDLVLDKKKKNPHFSIAPGIGFASENYYFKSFGMSWHHDSITRFYPLGDSISSKKSKLNTTYLDIPLEFRFRSTPNKKTGWSWKLAAGFKLGFLIGSKWKYKGESLDNSGENLTFKDVKVANMNKLRYGVYLRGGYGMFNLFAYYSLSDAFVANKGPKFRPIVFGLSINGL